ncbi:MAG: two-component system phosphate regulon sensor histidine kinase PhoR [Rhodothermales bacterium]|jgi:two-component system phosphate regulon sensor histidine kinase PhoR
MQIDTVSVQRQFLKDVAIVIVLGLISLWFATGWQMARGIPRIALDLQRHASLGARASASSRQAQCSAIAASSGSRSTWLSLEGTVLGDSAFGIGTTLPLGQYPEVQAAIAGEVGQAIRKDKASNSPEIFVAVPVRLDGQVSAVLRLSRPLPSRSAVLREASPFVAWGVLVLVLLMGLRLRQLRRLHRKALALQAELQSGPENRLPVCGIREIDEISLAANKVAKQSRKVDASAERKRVEWKAVFSSMQEGILLIDDSDELRLINPAAADFFDIPKAKRSLGKLYLEVIRDADLHEYVCAVRERRDNGHIQLHIEDEHGQAREFSLSGTRIEYRSEHGDAVLIVMSDITRLEKLRQMREQFAGNVSHELKTPLTSMSAYIELLAESATDESGYIAAISRQSQRMLAIVDDLLYLSRIEYGDSEFEEDFAPVAVRTLLQNCVLACQAEADQRTVSLNLQVGDESVFANSRLLEHAIVNLISNAVRHSPESGTVHIRAASSKQSISLEIADSGPGIAPEYQRSIFQRFFRIDKSRDRDSGGTGLGLAIVKHVVYLHGGRVWVESELGAGSRFLIELPQRQA